jgi:DNA-binding IclR family transcriptional regulator
MTTIRSVARASQILIYLGQQPDGRTAKEVAAAVRLPLPTAYHLLGTLVGEGLLAKDSRRNYYVGPRLHSIADAYLHQFTPPEQLVAPLHHLAEATDETAYIGCWRHDELAVLACVEGRNAVRVSGVDVGVVESAHARASGKALLAFAPESVSASYLRRNPLTAVTSRTIVDPDEFRLELERIRVRGFAMDEEEFRDGVACVAAPVIANGSTVAVYSVSAPVERFRRRRQELIERVLDASREAVESIAQDGGSSDASGGPLSPS